MKDSLADKQVLVAALFIDSQGNFIEYLKTRTFHFHDRN